ncbi:hypothetical protein Tco_1500055 [Tanacetum coccineum]
MVSAMTIYDIQFDEMKFIHLFEDYLKEIWAVKWVIRELKRQGFICKVLVLGYHNGSRMDLYAEIHGYGVLKMVADGNLPKDDEQVSEEDGDLSKDSDLKYVDFHTEGKGNFIGKRYDPIPPLRGTYILEEDDLDNDEIDTKYKIRNGVQYPLYNPYTPWKEFQPILGMTFESPKQLKLAPADYGVAHGYSLWYYREHGPLALLKCDLLGESPEWSLVAEDAWNRASQRFHLTYGLEVKGVISVLWTRSGIGSGLGSGMGGGTACAAYTHAPAPYLIVDRTKLEQQQDVCYQIDPNFTRLVLRTVKMMWRPNKPPLRDVSSIGDGISWGYLTQEDLSVAVDQNCLD